MFEKIFFLLVSCMEELLQEKPPGNLTILMSWHFTSSSLSAIFHLVQVEIHQPPSQPSDFYLLIEGISLLDLLFFC